MRPSLPILVLTALCCLPCVAAAQQPPAEPASSTGNSGRRARAPENPETLYATGLRQMKRGYYDEAILSFDRVRNHFPFNQYSVLSELRVADCMYEKASYVEAVDAYRQFARLHPRHAEIDYAVYRSARAQFKLAPTIAQRDQTHTRRGLRAVEGFGTRFPESEYLGEVERLRGRALARLSRGAVQVGNFYWKQREWKAAERRYRLAIEEFPDSPLVPRATYRRGVCLWKLGAELAAEEPERAAELQAEGRELLAAMKERFPESRWADRGLRFLEKNTPAPEEPSS